MSRFLVVAILLALTATYGRLHPPENLAVGRGALRAVPATLGPWSGTELSFQDGIVDELKADDVLLRRYTQGDHLVWLCLVYHQNRRYGAHDPELCYESQGFVVTAEGHARVDDGSPGGLEVSTFVAERKHVPRVIWYWWTTAGMSTGDANAFRGRMALLGALENRSWGAFVRVESVAPDGDLAAAAGRVRDFSGRVARVLPGVFANAATVPAAPAAARP
ncbi:MAG TPA: EpsI family protein [Candidatus Acidoferrales bacterium]|nr:EpsI family protein [Candidatus Acidoferrales bacterium]